MDEHAASLSTSGTPRTAVRRFALVGNPNTGKTTLFNVLCGLRHKTANFPGTTLDARLGRTRGPEAAATLELLDLPGVYSLSLNQAEARAARDAVLGKISLRGEDPTAPDGVCLVVDATNLGRGLRLGAELMAMRRPMVVAVTMGDLARARGLTIDHAGLGARLGCPVIAVNPRTGAGIDALRAAMASVDSPPADAPTLEPAAWSLAVQEGVVTRPAHAAGDTRTDRIDRVLTHPVLGLLAFAAVMAGTFWLLFRLATYPMDWIDGVFAALGGAVASVVPPGLIADFLVDGVIKGVGATVIFLPQICLLFFLISLLEDTGYLARAAFVMNRVLRPFGLPGHAFVPLLSAHACALPGIMACRAIPDRRERLAAILVAPFMTCSARLPVYVLVLGVLFADRPGMAAMAFVGAYALGASAGLLSALVARRTILRGRSLPMALELPSYKVPSLRTALVTTWDRGTIFLRKAGTVILAICIVLWWLGSFPRVAPPPEALDLRAQAAAVRAADESAADDLESRASLVESRHASRSSFRGRLGALVEPAFRPLGYDWQLSVGVLASFAAREVFVATVALVVTGTEDVEDERVMASVRGARRDDGSPVFTPAVAWSLLVFYVLAMQCLPTLAVTAREAGGVRWALLQFGWMTLVAYLAALVTYQALA